MLTSIYTILKDSLKLFFAQRALRLAAALAFYTLLSLSPLLIVAVGAIDMFFDDAAVRVQLTNMAKAELPENIEETVVSLIESAGTSTKGGLAATVISILIAVLAASNVFYQLQDILNRLWDIDRNEKPWLQTIREHAFSFVMVLGFGVLLMIVMIIQAALATIANILPHIFQQFNWVPIASTISGILLMALLFGLIFRILPDTEVSWRDALKGGLLTAVLFPVGLWGVVWYLGKTTAGAAYGIAGSLLVTLLVIYYLSIIFLFGAAVTRNIALADSTTALVREDCTS